MSILNFFQCSSDAPLPQHGVSSTITKKEVDKANEFIRRVLSEVTINPKPRSKYNSYSAEQRAQIGRYAVENGNTRAAKHFSEVQLLRVLF